MVFFIQWLFRFFCAVGAMNWGLKAFFDFDLVRYVSPMIRIKNFDKFAYGLIALSGLFVFLSLFAF
jgi:uncharacterized membrane protein YuzA (DUF378 family)